jgi:hypothetical protein
VTIDTYTASGCVVGVAKANGQKCGRCWHHDDRVGTLPYADVRQRCHEAIFSWEKQTGQSFATSTETEAEQPVA